MAPGATAAASRGPSKLQQTTKVRYWKGKPLGAELDPEDSDEDDEEEEEDPAVVRKRKQQQLAVAREVKVDSDVVAGGAGRIMRQAPEVKMNLEGVKVGRVQPVKKEEEESSEEEETDDEEQEEVKPKPTIPKAPGSESSEYETDSEEESEEEKKPAFRPVFVKKDQRGMTQEKAQALAEEKIRIEEESRDQRKNDSKEIAGETIRRELAEKEATDIQPDVDDTDNLDPTQEFELWRARELARLLREKQAQAARDEEKEEIERRRAMPEEQRLREDMEFAEATRNREKTEMGFLQKYYHKGAFYNDDNLLERDYTGATESAVDMSMLPKVMQVRDFGKASRTKYTHLADQDTSAGGWGNAARLPAHMGMGASGPAGGIGTTQTGCWNCGGPHLRSECPNQNINDPLVQLGVANIGSSANGAPLASGMSRPGGGGGDDRPRDGGYGQRGDRSRDGGYGPRGNRDERGYDGADRAGRDSGGGSYDGDRNGGDRRREDDRHGGGRYDDRKRARSPDRAEETGGRYRDKERGGREGDERRRRDERERGRDRDRDRERDRERRGDRDRR